MMMCKEFYQRDMTYFHIWLIDYDIRTTFLFWLQSFKWVYHLNQASKRDLRKIYDMIPKRSNIELVETSRFEKKKNVETVTSQFLETRFLPKMKLVTLRCRLFQSFFVFCQGPSPPCARLVLTWWQDLFSPVTRMSNCLVWLENESR